MNKLEELENKIKELSDEIERLKAEKKNEVWKPKDGDYYWMISRTGFVAKGRWTGDSYDDDRYAIGNVFKTDEEAKFRAEQLKVEAELRRFARPFVANEDNYSITFKHSLNTIRTWHGTTWQHNNIYFATEEIAQKAIDTVGEDRIKKYYFGIKVN